MSIKSKIKQNRRQIEIDLSHTDKWKLFSPVLFAQFAITLPMIKEHVHGNLLDAGCGEMPYREYILPFVTAYDGLDFSPRSSQVKFVEDIQDMRSIQENTYDSVICLEVLEHVPRPDRALREIYRVLKPGGKLVASVPHLSRLHDVPNDFFRYTCYGIELLLKEAGFTVEVIKHKGSILSFLGHQVSTILLTLVWSIPVLKDIVFFLNSWLITRLSFNLDRVLDRSGIMPLGYAFVAKKPCP